MTFEVEVNSFANDELYVSVKHEPTNRSAISFAMMPEEALLFAAQLIDTATEAMVMTKTRKAKTGSPALNAKNS